MAGQSAAVTEFTAYNNGGNSANAFAYKGSNDGSNHYTVNIPLPDDVPPNIVVADRLVVTGGEQHTELALEAVTARLVKEQRGMVELSPWKIIFVVVHDWRFNNLPLHESVERFGGRDSHGLIQDDDASR